MSPSPSGPSGTGRPIPGTLPTWDGPREGNRFTLLDPVRDAGFLGSSTIKNPVAPVNDGGLGVVDNGLFVYTSAYVPGTTTKRAYPVKFFWIGSPAGTTDANDAFSIYMADVDQSAYSPGAPATQWLRNPRLVLAVGQAKSDIITWFDANYPGGAVGGVGNGNTGSNTTYGILAGGGSNVGNISGMDSIDGQFWPIYDYVDGSMILYFSVKTPNYNTLAIYAYKTAANEGMENTSPLGSAQFLGGLYYGGWNNVGDVSNVLSSHRFSIVSPDPLVSFGRVAGQQSAVMVYSYGALDGATPDHGLQVIGSIETDVHGAPLAPGVASTSSAPSFDKYGLYPPDKLGNIFVADPTEGETAAYGVVLNTPSGPDRRNGSNAVVISAMQLRVIYYHAGTQNIYAGRDPLVTAHQIAAAGRCRPVFTSLPDGIPKILYANFTFDQNLNLGFEYVSADVASPKRQRRIVAPDQLGSQRACYSFGKRRGTLRFAWKNSPGSNPSLAAAASILYIQEATVSDVSLGALTGLAAPGIGYALLPQGFNAQIIEVRLEDLPPVFQLQYSTGATLKPQGGDIMELED
jgi:hypothetical protein